MTKTKIFIFDYTITYVNILGEGSHDGWHTWVEPEGFLDATLQVFELGRVLSAARTLGVAAKHLIHLFHDHLLHAEKITRVTRKNELSFLGFFHSNLMAIDIKKTL
jgi:hypothetical protein